MAVTLGVSLLAACGQDAISPGPDTGPLTAYIDGDAFIADSTLVVRTGNTGVEVSVTAWGPNGRSIAFEFIGSGPANYAIGPGNDVSASVTVGSSTWTAGGTTGSGVISVTALWATHIEGSFELTVVGGGSPQSRDVTLGRFNIDYF